MRIIDIFRMSISETGEVIFTVNWIVVGFFLVGIFCLLLWRKYTNKIESHLEIDEAEIGIGQGKLKFKANLEDLQIGYMFWVELSTRKIGLPIDESNDVLVEVYNSWYDFFGIARELIKSIPVSKIRSNASTRQIVRISIQILNKDLRPHLTKWQARYRKWWEKELEKPDSINLTPQQIQQKFPEYTELIKDMSMINLRLIAYKSRLNKMITGSETL